MTTRECGAGFDSIRKKAFKYTGIGIFSTNSDFIIEYMDDVSFNIFDLHEKFKSSKDVSGRFLSEIFSNKKDCESIISCLEENRGCKGMEHAFQTVTGRVKWILHDCIPLEDSGLMQNIIRDITPDKNQFNNNYFRRRLNVICDNAPFSVLTLWGSRILYFNEAACRLFGFDGSITGEYDIYPIIHPDFHRLFDARIRKQQENNNAEPRLEIKFITTGGKVFWGDMTFTDIRFDDSSISVVSIFDITRRKMEEEELIQSERRFRQLISKAKDGIIIISIKKGCLDRVIETNESFSAITGYTREELLGMDPGEFNLTCKHMGRNILKEIRDKGLVRFETSIRTKSGECITVENSAHFIDYSNEEAVFAISRDITERRFFENAIKESENKYRNLVETAQDIVFTCDLDGRITFLNTAFEKILKIPREEILGTKLIDYVIDEDRDLFCSSLLSNIAVETDKISMEVRIKTLENRTHVIRFNGTPLKNAGGNVVGIMGIGHDITDYKKMEEELRNKNNELNDFAYMVSHDLKNPLNLIKGFLYTIKENPELFDQYYQRVINQADSMQLFIDNMLKLSRVGRIIDLKEKVDIESLINKIFVICKRSRNDIVLSFHKKIPKLRCDPKGMEHIFSNLIQNAIQNRDPDKEKLELEITTKKDGDSLILSLKDNGKGFDNKFAAKLFNPGFTLRKDKGTGFGLTISKKIAEAHGGEIWADSPGKGQGAVFNIKLPIKG